MHLLRSDSPRFQESETLIGRRELPHGASTVDDVAGELSVDGEVLSTTGESSTCELSDVAE